MRRLGRLRFVGVATAVAATALAGCGGGHAYTPGSGPVHVVAAENFWGDIVAQIGGSHVHVTSIVSDPNRDPHEYQSDIADAAAINEANLVVVNGIGYDDFMGKLLGAAGNHSHRVTLSVQQVLGIAGGNPNPHIWYDTAALPQVAAAVADDLSAIDPPDAADYARAASAFDRSLQPILAVIATMKRRYAGTAVAYTERVPGYLVAAAGLTLGVPTSFAQAVEDGDDPSPSASAEFDAALSTRRVRVLLYNDQVFDTATTRAKQLAQRSGIPVVGVSETLPAGTTFQTWQLDQARALLIALGG